MTSKYGMQLYGADKYSSAITDLVGTALSFSTGMTARAQRSRSYTKTMPFTIGIAGDVWESESFIVTMPISVGYNARMTRSRSAIGALPFVTSFSPGILRENDGFRVTLPIVVNYNAVLSRPTPQKFIANLNVFPGWTGRLVLERHLDAPPLNIETVMDGSKVYLGPFWNPDVPVEDNWVPDAPLAGPWIPDTPEEPSWAPAAASREWS